MILSNREVKQLAPGHMSSRSQNSNPVSLSPEFLPLTSHVIVSKFLSEFVYKNGNGDDNACHTELQAGNEMMCMYQVLSRVLDPHSSGQLLSCVRFFVTPWTTAHQASLSIANSRSLFKLMSIESVMPSSHLILCHPLLLLPSIFPSIRVFSNRVSYSHQVAKVLEFQLQHQSFQWIFRTDFL